VEANRTAHPLARSRVAASPASRSRDPWSWRPSVRPWFRALEAAAQDWCPDDRLELDKSLLVDRLVDACKGAEEWLMHPCSNVLTLPRPDTLQRDFQLAVWVGSQSAIPMGNVTVPEPLWAWAADGGNPVQPGRHAIDVLGAQVAAANSPASVDLDLWCDSLGFPYPNSWAAAVPAITTEGIRLEKDISDFLRTVSVGQAFLPDCLAWARSVTKVAIPLRRNGRTGFRSGSAKEIPGMVVLDIDVNALLVLEALVHESAHHHLFLAEAASSLVDPDHDGTYHSPLRPEPRPLRGILLAYHALAYICAFYADAGACGLMSDDAYRSEAEDLLGKLADAEGTLLANRGFLTDHGNKFLDETAKVATYGRP
jgi:HEXXH motif-containing protein